MSSIQSLKKQLRGVRSTQKLTKAMKTISAAKFSKLNAAYGQYAEYGRQCRKTFERHQEVFLKALGKADPLAPAAFVVIAANKGLCGSFNRDVLGFAEEEMRKHKSVLLFPCGRKAIRYFQGRKLPVEKEYPFHDVPDFQESNVLLEDLMALRKAGKISAAYVVYPKYRNMLTQTPALCELFPAGEVREDQDMELLLPDRTAIMGRTLKTVFRAMLYQLVLQSALGAQAATLMTMRVGYDAATEYCAQLEGEINRKRQSEVTADVIETSSGETSKEENHG